METLTTPPFIETPRMTEDPIIRGIDAHKIYNSGAVTVHALRGVNLAIPRGEMVAIMGPSGCGKTTLLNCFSGLDDLTSGDVRIEGVSLSSMNDNEKSRYRSRRMGFVFQSYNLLPVLSAVENVELPLLVARVPAKEARRKAVALMHHVDLDGWTDHKPAQLSAGQQQRVAIARALVNDPAIVWADEPTGNLDSETSAQIMDLLVQLNRDQQQTLVLVTHDTSVSSHAHRILRMRNGQIVEETRGG
jgi:ABC-type lipoprotein export system ATPase subunit